MQLPAHAEADSYTPQVSLPVDELPHAGQQAEWWYYSGHLEDEDGHGYGVMASFFIARMGNLPATHFVIYALTEKDSKTFHSESLIQRGMIDMMKMVVQNPPAAIKDVVDPSLADIDEIKKYHRIMKEKPRVKKDVLAIKYGDNYFRKTKESSADTKTWEYRTKLVGDGFTVELKMVPTRNPMYVGGDGNVGMAAGEDMYYYSITRLATSGKITVGGTEHTVKGTMWYDHQFGSMGGPEKPVGWDWFCLQLDNGTDLNLSAIRDLTANGRRFNRLGTIQYDDGRTSVVHDLTIETLDRWTSPETGVTYPVGWRVALPSLKAVFTVIPDMNAQEMHTYGPFKSIWEGSCTVEGEMDGRPVSGNGYTELTGYSVP